MNSLSSRVRGAIASFERIAFSTQRDTDRLWERACRAGLPARSRRRPDRANSAPRLHLVHRTAIATLLACLPLLAPLARAALDASVDRRTIDENDVVVLELERDAGDFVGNPDLSGLEPDFRILGTQRASQFTIAGGETRSVTTWTVTLQPKRRGTLMIPSIEYEGDRTEPITITVTAPTPEEQAEIERTVFFETGIGKDDLWVQEQLLYTVRLYYAADAVLFGDLPPAPRVENAVIQPLGDSRPGTERRDGVRYNLIEQRYAIVPQRSGTLAIPPETFAGAVRIAEDGRTRRKNIRITSDGHQLDVRPQPESWPDGVPWLPARDLALSQSWNGGPPRFAAGEPVTRTLELFAKGVAASALPELSHGNPDNARIYPEPATLDEGLAAGDFVATRIQSAVIIPEAEGALTLPEVRVPWWDVERGEMRVAALPAARFRVAAGSGGSGAGSPTASDAPSAEPGDEAVDATPDGQASSQAAERPAETDEPETAPSDRQVGIFDVDLPWPWLAGALGLIALITAAILVRGRRSRATRTVSPEPTERRVVPPPAFEAALAACRENDPRAARTALGRWKRQAALTPAERRELEHRLTELDAELFGTHSDASWDGSALATWLNDVAKERRAARRRPQASPALPPLHPR